MKFNVKYNPLSVNDAWQGRRYKTEEYRRYERDLLLLLPRIKIPEPPYRLEIEFGIPTITFGVGLVFFLGSELLKERENDLFDFFKILGSFLSGGFTFKLIDKHYEN